MAEDVNTPGGGGRYIVVDGVAKRVDPNAPEHGSYDKALFEKPAVEWPVQGTNVQVSKPRAARDNNAKGDR